MASIGEEKKEITFEPIPEEIPAPSEPSPTPEREPEPAH
jgi:hypothetical protein